MWSPKPVGLSAEMILANPYLQSMMQERVKDTKAASHRAENEAILN